MYDAIVVRPLRALGDDAEVIDDYVVDGIVRLVGCSGDPLGRVGTRMQNGQLQSYGVITCSGCVILSLAVAGRRFIMPANFPILSHDCLLAAAWCARAALSSEGSGPMIKVTAIVTTLIPLFWRLAVCGLQRIKGGNPV